MTTLINHDNLTPHLFAFELIAQGGGQAGAYPIPANRNVFTTVPSGSGCILGNTSRPAEVVISNYGANTLNVYPPGGWAINNGTINAPVTIAANASLTFITGSNAGLSPPMWWSR